MTMNRGKNMNKNNRVAKAWIWWLVALGLSILFILVNSLLDYDASHAFSGWFVGLLGLDSQAGPETGDFLLRKIAHVTEYALLGFLTQTVRTLLQNQGKKISIWLPLFCVLAVGVLDEFFQSFSNRTGAVSDVLLDFTGGVAGILIALFIYRAVKKHKKHIGGNTHE